MGTTKPQFNCYIDPEIDEEIAGHMKRTSIPRGKLVEQMWRFFNMRNIPQLAEKLELYISKGLTERDALHLRRLLVVLQRTVGDGA